MPRSDQQYISWADVSALIADVEADYPCQLKVTMVRAAEGPRDSVHWFVEAVDGGGNEFTPRRWRGRRYPNLDHGTVPGLLVGLILGLCIDLDVMVASIAQWETKPFAEGVLGPA
jgi:hypothetical protein